MKIKFFLIIILFFSCSTENKNYQLLNDRVKDYQNLLINNEILGSNSFVLFKDKEIIVNSTVNTNLTDDMVINDQTIFPIWSLTKTITGIAMMILYEREMISFDDKLSDYIPYFKDTMCKNSKGNLYRCSNEITIFHLMTHRSGYPNSKNYPARDNIYNDLDKFVKDVSNYPVEFEPGSKYLYGASYDILGRVIEIVSGQTFYDFLNENIFIPLGMTNTKFFITDYERQNFQILHVKDDNERYFTYELDQNSYLEEGNGHFGGSGLVSTIPDMMKFSEMLLNKGTHNELEILSPNSFDIMTKPYTKDNYNNGFYSGWDIGFSLFILNEPLYDGSNAPQGIYRFAGYHNNHFWIDYENNLYGLFMTRSIPHSKKMIHKLRSIIYDFL